MVIPWPGSDRPDAAPSQVFTDLAAGLRVVRAGVADPDSAQLELHLEGDPAVAALFSR